MREALPSLSYLQQYAAKGLRQKYQRELLPSKSPLPGGLVMRKPTYLSSGGSGFDSQRNVNFIFCQKIYCL